MNLHGIVSPIIEAVNPRITATVQHSTGWEDGDGGLRVPTYSAAEQVPAQVQSLQYRDMVQMDGLNLQGTRRAIYLYGRFDGVVRSEMKGGDLITIPSGAWAGTYLVALVGEQWPDWCRVLCTLQND